LYPETEQKEVQVEDRFLSMEETCERLNKTRQGIHYMVVNGKLIKYERGIGNEVFFKESEVESLLKIREAA
jgi:predicted DNA-binding transcriptional regulator AlpA